MRRFAFFCGSVLLLVCLGVAEDRPKSAPSKTADPADSPVKIRVLAPGDEVTPGRDVGNRSTYGKQPSAEEEAIRASAKEYLQAFSAGDAKAIARQFTETAEYVDAQGITYEGRQAIEDLFGAFFTNYPERKLDLTIHSIRVVSPTVAVEDGVTTITYAKDQPVQAFQYTAVHVKNDGQWLTASVRDRALKSPQQHRTKLAQLEWLVGDWVHEGNDAVVHFSCHPVDNGSFLLREFIVQVAGQQTMTGTQRIGWDPQAAKFRTWVFDSDGGYSEGFWQHDGDKWTLRLTGVTPDGQAASSTSIYSFVDQRTMNFRSVQHEVGGVAQPDSAVMKIVRQPPQLEAVR